MGANSGLGAYSNKYGTFKVRGAKLWNRIPLDMRMRKKDTAGAFKNALKNIF